MISPDPHPAEVALPPTTKTGKSPSRTAGTAESRRAALARFADGWQSEHGALTAAEIARAEHELDLAPVQISWVVATRKGRDPERESVNQSRWLVIEAVIPLPRALTPAQTSTESPFPRASTDTPILHDQVIVRSRIKSHACPANTAIVDGIRGKEEDLEWKPQPRRCLVIEATIQL